MPSRAGDVLDSLAGVAYGHLCCCVFPGGAGGWTLRRPAGES